MNRGELINSYLDRILLFVIDKPLGSRHPNNGITYLLNYGFIADIINGDGIEVYLIGVDTPFISGTTYVGECIAVIHRLDNTQDKLVLRLLSNTRYYTSEEIKEQTHFQEKYFKTDIVVL